MACVPRHGAGLGRLVVVERRVVLVVKEYLLHDLELDRVRADDLGVLLLELAVHDLALEHALEVVEVAEASDDGVAVVERRDDDL